MRRLPKTVVKLGWVSFFADICSEMVYPLLPLFLKATLGAPASLLGLIEGSAESVVSLMKGWAGFHSDHTGRRLPYIQWGYGLSAFGKPLIGLATFWPTVLLARVVDRVGKGVRTTARDALIADCADPESLGTAYGFHRAMDTAGALVGVAIAIAFLVWLPSNLRAAFLIAGIPGLISLAITLAVRDVDHQKGASRQKSLSIKEAYRAMPPKFKQAVAISLLFAAASTSDTFLLLRARELGLENVQVVLGYAVYNLTYMLASWPLGKLSDRYGRWSIMLPGWVLYAAVYVGFATSNAAALWWLFAIYGLAIASNKGVGVALIADHAPAEARGAAMGLFYLVTGLITWVANVATGFIYDKVSPSIAFNFAAVCALSGVVFALFSLNYHSPNEKTPPLDNMRGS